MIDSSMILKATFEKIIESINIGIFDLLHTGVALFCDKGFFIYCNKSFLKMYNLPESVIGKHITDYFLTGERGVMSSIRTRKMVICSSQTKNNVWGVSFRYPIQDEQGQLRGVVVESIPSNLDKDKLLALLDTVRNLEMKSYSFSEQKEAHKIVDCIRSKLLWAKPLALKTCAAWGGVSRSARNRFSYAGSRAQGRSWWRRLCIWPASARIGLSSL